MNEWNRLKNQAKRMKEQYPPGTRILLLKMGSDPHPIEDNTRGIVTDVDDIGTIFCKFDNGRSLGIITGEDVFRKLTQAEILEEQNATGEDYGLEEGMVL